MSESKRQRPRRIKLVERGEERKNRAHGRWDQPSQGTRGRLRWILPMLVAPVVTWAMLSVLASGKHGDVLTPAHLIILVTAIAVLGAFVWDASNASRKRTWRSSWRSSKFRLACVRLFVRDEPIRCPYCHDTIEDDPVACTGCQATLHTACRGELGGCATLGCVESNAPGRDVRDGKGAPAKVKA